MSFDPMAFLDDFFLALENDGAHAILVDVERVVSNVDRAESRHGLSLHLPQARRRPVSASVAMANMIWPMRMGT